MVARLLWHPAASLMVNDNTRCNTLYGLIPYAGYVVSPEFDQPASLLECLDANFSIVDSGQRQPVA